MTSQPTTWTRPRPWYVLLVVGVILTGLASRKFPGLFPAALGKYPGDVLWALMVFLGWGLIFPKSSTIRITLYALTTACLVEFGKLYQAEWLENFRNTTIGHLALGYQFSWLNLAAYIVGITLGALGEGLWQKRPFQNRRG